MFIIENGNIDFYALISASLIGIISIIISVFTLRQNSKMIEESSRPVLSFYLARPYQNSNVQYVILKNFGSSQATVYSLSTDIDLSTVNFDKDKKPFENIVHSLVAPQQKFIMSLDPELYVSKQMPENITFTIEYGLSYTGSFSKYLKKQYKETYTLNMYSYVGLSSLRSFSTNTNKDPIEQVKQGFKNVAEGLQDINEQLL